jgi:23S rRNA (adenine2503-C2)-methyltransferase
MSSTAPINLLELDQADCERLMMDWGYKPFHGRNLFKWLHKHQQIDFSAMTDLSVHLRERLHNECIVALPQVITQQRSADDVCKWLLELDDGHHIEMVHIPEPARHTICISSQVGCALGCRFCATAQHGFRRNLTTGEIVGQVWLASQFLQRSPTNIVLMGMGEPLLNVAAVVKALTVLQDDLAYMLARHRVTVSTVGIVPGIEQLRIHNPVALAVSLHAPDNELRDQLIPINRKYPLELLIPACRAYVQDDRRRRITWEYVMLADINDSDRHAKSLIRLLEGLPSKVNLIPFNPFPKSTFQASSLERMTAFQARLSRSGLVTTIRKPRGTEIAAACGQLVAQVTTNAGEH